MHPFRIPACIEGYLRSKARPPFSLSGDARAAVPPPSHAPGAGELVAALRAASRDDRPVELSVEDSGDAVAGAAILLSLAARLGVPPARPQGDLFDAATSRAPLRMEICRDGVVLPDRGTRPLVAPRDGLSLSGAALAAVDAAARAGAIDYPSEFVAFDLETTGRDPWADEIIEIGAIRYADGREAGAHSTFVKPRGTLPAEIVEITHIDDGMLRDAPEAPEALKGFLGFCGGLPLVAHNAPFDLAFLRQQARLGLGWEPSVRAEDTLLMSRWLHPDAPGHRLGDVARLLGIPIENWHRAVYDARTAAKIYLSFTGRGPDVLRGLRALEQLDLAALGTIVSGRPLEGENGLMVRHGMRMMARNFCLSGCARAARMERPPSPCALAGMLLSLDDRIKQRAALHLLSAITSP